MTDVVLDTTALKLLLREKYPGKIVEKCDHIYLPWCVWKKQGPGVYSQFTQTMFTSFRKLEKKEKLSRRRKGGSLPNLPSHIRKGLDEEGADKCNIEVARYAYERKGKGEQNISLVSSDPDIKNNRRIFSEIGINVRSPREEVQRTSKH